MRIQTTNKTYHVDASEIMSAWRKGNDNGDGYAAGDEDMTPSEAACDEGYQEQGDLGPEQNVVAVDGSRVIAICDANGPWAVDVTDALDD